LVAVAFVEQQPQQAGFAGQLGGDRVERDGRIIAEQLECRLGGLMAGAGSFMAVVVTRPLGDEPGELVDAFSQDHSGIAVVVLQHGRVGLAELVGEHLIDLGNHVAGRSGVSAALFTCRGLIEVLSITGGHFGVAGRESS
jgi:hypothetical protein